jgi:hypothetical protein
MSSNDDEKQRSEADAELEREIRKDRKFTLAEAIGRMAGPGAMKGESPITRKQQAEAEIETWLRRNVTAAEGALQVVMLRQIKLSKTLLDNFDKPLVVLAAYCQRALDSDYFLQELVRDADIEWGQVFGERPYFEKDGAPPNPNDPCTIESVRNTLSEIIKHLTTGD